MKKSFIAQCIVLLLISGVLVGLFVRANAYEETKNRIVDVLCLSCIKLEPKTLTDFTFKTGNNALHPSFVTENLTKGPVFLHYSEDVCPGCDVMFPIVKQLFNVEFGKQDMFWQHIPFESQNMTYIYINNDHTTEMYRNSYPVYDKEHIGGVPMFAIITLGYDHGVVRPYYTTLYATLNVPTDADRLVLLREIVQESIEVYHQNQAGYQHH
jgi:hypothetical protein